MEFEPCADNIDTVYHNIVKKSVIFYTKWVFYHLCYYVL
jgi:hypothetical protein